MASYNPQDFERDEEEKMPDNDDINNPYKSNQIQDDEDGDDMQIPLSLVSCPISGQIMKNPVIVNGRDYE